MKLNVRHPADPSAVRFTPGERRRAFVGHPSRHRAWRALLCALPLLGGCGGATLSHVVARGALRDVSRLGQVTVYDAENEMVIALDQLDEAEDALRETRRQLRLAERSVKRAEQRRGPAGVRLAEAWVDYLENLSEWHEAQVELRRLGLVVAAAAIELTKAQVVQREDLPGGKDFTLRDFRRQHEQLQARFEREDKRLKRRRERVRQQELRWWELRRRSVAQTGDHNTAMWVD